MHLVGFFKRINNNFNKSVREIWDTLNKTVAYLVPFIFKKIEYTVILPYTSECQPDSNKSFDFVIFKEKNSS